MKMPTIASFSRCSPLYEQQQFAALVVYEPTCFRSYEPSLSIMVIYEPEDFGGVRPEMPFVHPLLNQNPFMTKYENHVVAFSRSNYGRDACTIIYNPCPFGVSNSYLKFFDSFDFD